MKKIYLSLFLLVTSFFFGQNQKSIDSCEVIIKSTKNDTLKLSTMAHLSMIVNVGRLSYPKHEYEMISLARKILCQNMNKKIVTITKGYLAQANYNVGYYYQAQGDFNKALTYDLKGLNISKQLNDRDEMANGYNNIGAIYQQTGQFSKAIEYFYKTLKLDEEAKNYEYVASTYNNIGSIYFYTKQNEEAKKCFLKALTLAEKLKSYTILPSIYNNISAVYDAEKKPNLGIKYQFKAIEISKKINNTQLITINTINLGKSYYTGLNQFENAKKYLNEGLQMAVKYGYKPQQSAAFSNLGRLYNILKEYKTAKKYSLQSYKIAKANSDFQELSYTTKNLSDSYTKLKDYKNAYLMQLEYVKYKDTIEGEKAKKINLKSEIKYNYEKKSIKDSIANANQKIIASVKLSKEKNQKLAFGSFALLALAGVGFTYFLYRQKRKTNFQLTEINDKINRQNNTLKTLNTELIVSEENLQKSNSSKEQLISMMSHDLLNPITAITNYNQQIISRKNNSEELLQAFKTVDAAIQPIHGLLDNMLHWTAIQKEGISVKLKKQDVNEILKEIIGIYRPQAQLKFIKLNEILDANFVLESDKSILSLILRNLLNNAIKYSGNETEIFITSNAKTKTITIKDQGFGMTDEMIGYLNSKKIDKIESRGTGLGLKLCYEFAEAINAEIVFERNENVGITVDLKL